MNLNFRQVATELARAHRSADAQTTVIKQCGSPSQSEIYLLEVSKSAPTTNEVLPFRFAADPTHGIPYPSVVILLSPDEWKQVESGTLALPQGWDLPGADL